VNVQIESHIAHSQNIIDLFVKYPHMGCNCSFKDPNRVEMVNEH
jgi:hypothetical protein